MTIRRATCAEGVGLTPGVGSNLRQQHESCSILLIGQVQLLSALGSFQTAAKAQRAVVAA